MSLFKNIVTTVLSHLTPDTLIKDVLVQKHSQANPFTEISKSSKYIITPLEFDEDVIIISEDGETAIKLIGFVAVDSETGFEYQVPASSIRLHLKGNPFALESVPQTLKNIVNSLYNTNVNPLKVEK